MAEININSKLTFRELANRLAPGDKDLLEIAEVMVEKNEMLLDIPWFQCNQILSEKIGRRTSLPTGTWRKAYGGVASKVSTTQVVIEPVALLEARSEIDEDIVDNAPDPMGFRRSEDIAFAEGLAQQLADAYLESESANDPEKFDGLKIRLNDLDQTNVIDGGNSGGSSIYGVDWGRRKTYGIYPAAAANRGTLGLQMIDKDKEKVFEDPSTELLAFYAYVTQFKWWTGLAIKDELSTVRYCNINATIGGSNSFNENKLIELMNRCHLNPATTRLYANAELKTQMQIKLKDKGNVNFTLEKGLSGVEVLNFNGAPVRHLDAIKINESTVTS